MTFVKPGYDIRTDMGSCTYERDKYVVPFAFSFLPMSVNLIFTAYFYSTKQTVKSDVIAVNRGIVVKALAVFLIPAVLGEGYVWCSAAAAEAVTLAVCLFLGGAAVENPPQIW